MKQFLENIAWSADLFEHPKEVYEYFDEKRQIDNEEYKILINDKVLENYNYINDFKEIYNLYETTGENRYLVSALELYTSKIRVLDEEILKMKYSINYIENPSF